MKLLTKKTLVAYLIKNGLSKQNAEKHILRNWDFLVRCYGLDTSKKEASNIIQVRESNYFIY